MPLIYLSCAWVAGVFLGSNLDLPLALSLAGLIPIPLLGLAHRYRKIIVIASLGVTTLFVAAAYSHSALNEVSPESLRFYNERGLLAVRGIVAGAPEVGDNGTRLRLSATAIRLENGWHDVEGTALVFVPKYPAYDYGDILTVTGKLETPSELDGFDYRGYLAHQGIYSTMYYPRIEIQERGKGFAPLAWIYSLRNRLSAALAGVLPEPQASLAQGILLGIRTNIPAPIKADFYRTGTTHILAISGMNLGIVAGILLGLGIWLFGRRHYMYIWLALATIWSYSLLTGMQPPVVRSAVMASVFLAAELLGRQRSAIVALTFTAAIMVGISPYVLGDVSFQLSFLAMAGLVFFYTPLQGLGRRAVAATLGENGALASAANIAADGFAVTLAAVIAVWPAVAYYFSYFSLVGPLATVLVLPALPAIIILAALSGAMGLIFVPAAHAFGWLAWAFLSYMIAVVGILAKPSVSAIEFGPLSSGWVWAYYVALAAAIWLGGRRKKLADSLAAVSAGLRPVADASLGLISRVPKKWILPPLLVAALLVSVAAASMPDDRLHVSVLDVGEGDAILIQKGNQKVLIDGGPSPRAVSLGLGGKMPFWDRTIDLMVMTHPHQDHIAGLVDVLQRYQVEQVLYPDIDYKSPVYDEWLKLVRGKAIQSTIARTGQRIDLGGGAVITVLNPPSETLPNDARSDIDNYSLVLRLSLGNFSFLLTADTTQAVERELIRQRADLASTILKVAHHGSATSTAAEFLAVVNPQIAVISVGADNRAGHPNREVLGRLEERPGAGRTYRTDRDGTVEFITDGDRLWVKTARAD